MCRNNNRSCCFFLHARDAAIRDWILIEKGQERLSFGGGMGGFTGYVEAGEDDVCRQVWGSIYSEEDDDKTLRKR